MLITQIIEVSKGRYKIYLDYELACILYKGEIRKYNIMEGHELEEETYSLILKILLKRAKLRSMNLLKNKDYTKFQLEQKLQLGGYPKEIISEVILFLEEYHYVNDERYACNYIRYQSELKSKRMIKCELDKRGISKDIQKIAWEKWVEDGNELQEEQLIAKLLIKKNWTEKCQDEKEKQKIINFLFRKGFNMNQIVNVIKNIEND